MVNYSKPDIGVFRRDTKIHWDTANELRMVYLQNRSGQSVTTGEVVVWDTANPNSFKLTTTEGDVNVCGVIAQALDEDGNATTQTIANLGWGWVQTAQRCPKVKLSTTASVGDFIQTSTTAGLGNPSADASPGSFAIALTSGTEVECLLGFISPSRIGLNIKAGLLYTDTVNDKVGVGTMEPASLIHSQKFSSQSYSTAFTGDYAYSPYPHEVTIKNPASELTTGVADSFTGLFFYAGDYEPNLQISSARISAVRTGNKSAALTFGTRSPTSFEERMRLTSGGNLGIGTKDVPNIITVVQYSPTDPIADAWTTYSTKENKQILEVKTKEAFEEFLKYPVYCWKHNLEKVANLPSFESRENEAKKADTKVLNSKKKFQNRYWGLLAEEAPPALQTYTENDELIGINSTAYVGWLHAVLYELVNRLKEARLI